MRCSHRFHSGRTFLVGLLLIITTNRSSIADDSVRQKAEHFAAKIVYLRAYESLYHVQGADQPVTDFAAFVGKTREQDWWPLLKHESPRVRALAITAIRWKDNPKSLGRVFPLCNDEAQTFDCFEHPHSQAGAARLVRTRQTVARFARRWVTNYLAAAQYDCGGYFEEPDLSGFPEYWEARKDRADCYSWVRLAFPVTTYDASSGADATVLQETYASVRARIEAMPSTDGFWTLLGLATPDPNGYIKHEESRFASHAELVTAARKLGSQRLVLLASGRLDSQDPDLRLPIPVVEEDDDDRVQYRRRSPFPEHNVCRWLFRHADEIFDEADIPLILESTQRRFKFDGLIAAARLSSKASDRYLNEAKQIAESSGGIEVVCVGLWELRREQELKTILDWYFNTARKDGWMPAFKQLMSQPTSAPLVLAIWKDERCASLTWRSISELIRATNAHSQERVVSWDEQKKSRPAFGGRRPGKGATGEYKRDDKAVTKIVADWRSRIVPALTGR